MDSSRGCIALLGALFGASYPAWLASRKMQSKLCRTTRTRELNPGLAGKRSDHKENRKSRDAERMASTNGNHSYNTDTCRRADFPGKKERGADTQNRKLVEALPRRESRSPGIAWREFRSAARRIGCRDGPSGCGKSSLLYVDWRLGASFPRKVLVDGNDLSELSDAARTKLRRHKIGFVFSDSICSLP